MVWDLRQGQEPWRKTRTKWGIRSTFLWLSLITRSQQTCLVVRKFRWWLKQTQFMDRFLPLWQGGKGVQDDLCDAEFPKLHRSVGIGEGRIEMWPGAMHFWCGKCFDQTAPIHSSDCDCNARRLERELGALEKRAKLIIQGQLRAFRESHLNEIQDRSWTRSCVDGMDGTTMCTGWKRFPGEGNQRERLIVLSEARITPEKLCHLEKCAWGGNHSEDGAKLNMRWMWR